MLDSPIQNVENHKHLGVIFSNDGSWHHHINHITEQAWKRIHIMRRLKFKLNRDSLNTIYISFVRPLLEYADVVWDNCTQTDKNELDKIQHEAARIVTGCTRLVSLHKLQCEVGWETLASRRSTHKLTLFYKMVHGLAPEYLSSLVPSTVGLVSSYNLRNSQHLTPIPSRTTLYANSFLPSVVCEWNSLPLDIQKSESVSTFRNKIKGNNPQPNKLFCLGERYLQVLHTRLRTDCSSLAHHLFSKNILPSPLCVCGDVETTKHFFLTCPRFQVMRTTLLQTISSLCNPTLSTILQGDNSLSFSDNIKIFEAVHAFISETHRFDTTWGLWMLHVFLLPSLLPASFVRPFNFPVTYSSVLYL